MTRETAKNNIIQSVKDYYLNFMRKNDSSPARIPYAGRVFDEREVVNLVESALEFWLTAGVWTERFETGLAGYLGIRYCSFVNSGSSANLLAFMALTSEELGRRAVRRGDEVISVAAAFPTTVAPILQFGAVPVFVDITIPEYNIDVSMLEKAYSPKCKAVFIAHTLGNPFNLSEVKKFCDAHDLWLIEDNCDALGARYFFDGTEKFTGTVGDIGTSSFYPPHHITTGEGGAVYTDNPLLHKIIRSLRDWGRDCICPPGVDNRCGRRFSTKHGELPEGYDHKYVYGRSGYNLKATDMQAAVGCAQLEKLDGFIEKRRANWQKIYDGLSGSDLLVMPRAEAASNPSWFGFMTLCREDVNRTELVKYIESRGIQTRLLFAGNLIKHPCFDSFRGDFSVYRVVGELKNTDLVMLKGFWVGVYPGLNSANIENIIETINAGVKKNERERNG